MNILRRGARLAVVLASEVALVAGLVAVGHRAAFRVPWDRLGPWLHHAPAADVLIGLLRWPALVGAGWLLVSTLLYLAASASRLPAAVRAVRWSTLPVVRRTVDAALAASVVTGMVLAPAGAGAADAPRPTSVTIVRDGRSGRVADPAPSSTTIAAPPVPAAPMPAAPIPAAPMPAAPVAPPAAATTTEIVVAPGDNLWELAATHLAAVSGRSRTDVSDAEIAPYWVQVCDANAAGLASGDPNLLYPGEHVVLPPVS